MICERALKRFCCEDPSLIENYDKAMADSKTWHCHHRLETDEGLSRKQLIEMGLYWKRPASELIFLTKAEHNRLHHKGKQTWNKGKKMDKPSPLKGRKNPVLSAVKKGKKIPSLSIVQKGKPKTKYKWLTPDGEYVTMSAAMVLRWHPDWVRIGLAE